MIVPGSQPPSERGGAGCAARPAAGWPAAEPRPRRTRRRPRRSASRELSRCRCSSAQHAPARGELDAHLVADTPGPNTSRQLRSRRRSPPGQQRLSVVTGSARVASPCSAGRPPASPGTFHACGSIRKKRRRAWSHDHGSRRKPALGIPGTGIELQPAPPVDADRAMQDGDGLIGGKTRCQAYHPARLAQGRTRPVPRRIRPHDLRLSLASTRTEIPLKCGVRGGRVPAVIVGAMTSRSCDRAPVARHPYPPGDHIRRSTSSVAEHC